VPAFEQHDFGVIGHAHCFGLSFEFGPSHFTCSFGCNLSRVVAGSPIAASVRRARVPLASGRPRAVSRARIDRIDEQRGVEQAGGACRAGGSQCYRSSSMSRVYEPSFARASQIFGLAGP
jgi:hypothetical protein